MTGWLLDTNIVSELARREPDERVVTFLAGIEDGFLSVISLHELTYGVQRRPRDQRRADLANWLSVLETRYADRFLPVDQLVANSAAELRAHAASNGSIVHLADALIAATAVIHRLSIATRNVNDFAGFGLHIINPWTDT